MIIQDVQRTEFTKENSIPETSEWEKANIDSASELKLFIDSKELLRCGGRIHNAPLTEMTKFHYFLPTNQQLTYLIVTGLFFPV